MRAWALLMLAAWLAAAAAAAPAPPAPLSACQAAFVAAMRAAGKAGAGDSAALKWAAFIDPATPADACAKPLCQGPFAACDPNAGAPGPLTDLQLVFSDEFVEAGREFGVKAGDPRWTAQDMYYFPTTDLEVYKPEQVTTYNGKMVLTMDRARKPEQAATLQPDGTKWDVYRNFKSGMVSGWNKWCYTGGYAEISVRLPGDDKTPGFWPAFWMMGNLGRAGFMPSTSGLWPYSYSACPADGLTPATSAPGSRVPAQLLTACAPNATAPGFVNRTAYGMDWGVARNAPEFDVFEVIVKRGAGSAASQTLQMAPLLPAGASWDDLQYYADLGIEEGVLFPGATTRLRTERSPWKGTYGRPGNEYQDSISAESFLNSSFYSGFHTFGVDWAPGEYMRWYIDGQFAYEVNPNALLPRSGLGADGKPITIAERLIPLEPSYIILNLGMSRSFGEVDIDALPIPAHMIIDNVRVWQRPDKLNVGCSPKGMPTEQWIACHRDDYVVSGDDDVLIPATCISGGARRGGGGGIVVAAALLALAAAAL